VQQPCVALLGDGGAGEANCGVGRKGGDNRQAGVWYGRGRFARVALVCNNKGEEEVRLTCGPQC